MSEFLIDQNGDNIWYDIKSNTKDYDNNIWYSVMFPNETVNYFRPHREDGPAFVGYDECEAYYIEGNRHREDGPAIIWEDADVEWYLNDIEYSFEEWCKKLNKSEEEINFLKLKWNIYE